MTSLRQDSQMLFRPTDKDLLCHPVSEKRLYCWDIGIKQDKYMIPAYLYQYTTMNSVLAILENRTIRFTRLDSLNDLNEGCCGEYAHLKKYVYVSSWSADERESIPMWSLYGRKKDVLDEGVRIKAPTNLFTFDLNGNLANLLHLERILSGWNAVVDVKTKPIALSPVLRTWQEIYGDGDEFIARKQVVGPIRVNYMVNKEYTDKYSSTLRKEYLGTRNTFFPDQIGYEKADDWSYENEYRFWMRYPYMRELRGDDEALKGDIQYIEGDYIDVFFNEKAIPEMELLLAPNFNMSKIESFKSRLKKLGFTKDLQKSALDVRI